MNIQNDSGSQSSQWLLYIQNQVEKIGKLDTLDLQGKPVVLAWEVLEGQSPRLTQKIRIFTELLTATYTQSEVDFARHFSQEVPHERFLKDLQSLFEQGMEKVDWMAVHAKVESTLRSFFITTDFAQFAGADDLHLFIEMREQETADLLGIVQLLVIPAFEFGTLRICFQGITTQETPRGLEQILMSSLFKVIPDVRKLFLHTRITNKALIALYESWDFRQAESTSSHWIHLEYETARSMVLQEKVHLFGMS